MTDTITMAHGAGGKQTSELIHGIFEKHLGNEYFTADDAAVLPPVCGRLAMTTDGFIVSPQFFPGGNIGKLSICGTVNDLSCMGARPLYMTCAFVIEEGFRIDELDQIAAAMAKTAGEAGVRLVAGDTKVAGKGQCGGVFITTTGVGEIVEGVRMSGACARPGDAVIVTGDIGRHGTAILLARDDYGIEAEVTSDCAPLWKPVEAVLSSGLRPHVIRDATRGGVGTVLYEIAAESGVGIRLETEKIPVQPAVRGVTGMLGLEPLYLACEGRLVIVCPQEETGRLLEILHGQTCTEGAAVIGCITAENKGRVVMTTQIGAQTLLPEPGNELLPRIC
ncbi:MAG: hydrogenase expression/formation protein HypE [Porcincola intestinalis]|nr:hydrogenase expression/formation protein HypE [Porcincola intestinalis]MCI6698819.1 hydrogenase expression/formation protein HypE [Lachnospiraceae bacterium]MCI6767782.1 hydrogenase expression/formation protein HypE [Lachnospiraceae bacterium]MDD7060357.1 hydrogenase expression/formation protein HypE [Porcincola intestinalis]MDY5282377.1 hydrogenase expression/formation protein HypE [Porcincola intestinalis]